ncbi:MAG: hypothetical protein ACKOTZ_07695 [Chloroflexota bacterium]
MQTPRIRRTRQVAAVLGVALALGATAVPAAARSPLAPSATELAGIAQANGAKRCVVRHDGVSYTNLQDGVDAAEEGEVVTLQGTCAGFTYIDKDLTIKGVRTATSGMPTITGRRTIPLLHVAGLEVVYGSAGSKVRPAGTEPGWNTVATIIGIRLMRGFHASEGAIFIGDGSGLILRNALVTRNRGTENGAIDGDGNTLLVLRGSTEISRNRAIDGDGGAVDFGADSRIEMHGTSRIHHNRSWEDGGAIYIGPDSVLVMNDDTSIDSNRTISDDDAGGIDAWSETGGLIELNDRARIAGNRSSDDGGGIDAYNYTIVLNDDARIVNNVADYGGGVRLGSSELYINDTARISSNYGDRGGGIYAFDGSLVAASGSSRIGSNRAVIGNGGGIHATDSTVSLSGSSRVTGNRAVTQGGGVWLGWSTLTMSDTAWVDTNRVISGNGGGVWAIFTDITLGGSAAIEDNRAPGRGGGVHLDGPGELDMDGSALIRDNIAGAAANSGGGVWASCAATLTDLASGTNVYGNSPDQVFWETC